MNLWAKSFGQLAVLAVALIFFSCEDETISGYKTEPKFDIKHAVLDIPTNVVWIDSLRTSNAIGEFSRLLVGQYQDPVFGKLKATAYSQFFTTSSTKLNSTATLDSVVLNLRYDFYYYGNASATTSQQIEIYELDEELKRDSLRYYFNTSTQTTGRLLGSKSFTFDTEAIKDYIEEKKDTSIFLSVPLNVDPSFGLDIVELLKTTVKYDSFITKFKGIAIVPVNNDKIIGINPGGSRITLHYRTFDKGAVKDTLKLDLGMGTPMLVPMVNYTNITADRSGTVLADLTQYHHPFEPSNGLRYVQSGTGILTQLDLSNFFHFADADSNRNILINEATISISGVDAGISDSLSRFTLLVGDNYNSLLKTKPGTLELFKNQVLKQKYDYFISSTGTGNFVPLSVNKSPVTLYNSNGSYLTDLTFFLQAMHDLDEQSRFKYFFLFPDSHNYAKAVNGFAFNKDNIKLEITYTIPSDNINP